MSEGIIIGQRQLWGGEIPFGLSVEDRRRHLFCLGKTGSGKTTLLKNLLVQDILAGNGVALIDPHGDLAEEILDFIPSCRTKDVVYFNPADIRFPIGINLFHDSTPETGPLIASGIVSCFKHIWGNSWGPRMEYVLYASALSLSADPSATLLGLIRLLNDSSYRKRVLNYVTDPVLLSFWRDEFDRYEARFRQEVISPIQNKIGAILLAPALRNIVGQVKSTVSIPFVMENRRIFIANLSKGKLGEDKASLLGSLLVTQFQLAAMNRAGIPESARQDFFLYVDEFSNVATDSFCSILSEARKYRLSLTLGAQFNAQLRLEIRDAIYGNVGSIISFRTGIDDAELLAREFGNGLQPEAFTGLSNYEILVRLLNRGESMAPFRGRTLLPLEPSSRKGDMLVRVSRERFGMSKEIIESKIKKWLETSEKSVLKEATRKTKATTRRQRL